MVRPSTGEERHVFQEQVSLTYPKEACFQTQIFLLLHRLWNVVCLFFQSLKCLCFLGAAAL